MVYNKLKIREFFSSWQLAESWWFDPGGYASDTVSGRGSGNCQPIGSPLTYWVCFGTVGTFYGRGTLLRGPVASQLSGSSSLSVSNRSYSSAQWPGLSISPSAFTALSQLDPAWLPNARSASWYSPQLASSSAQLQLSLQVSIGLLCAADPCLW